MNHEISSTRPAAGRRGSGSPGLFLPVGLILLISIAVIAALLAVAARGQDRIAQESSVRLARSAVMHMSDALAELAKEYGWWDELRENLVVHPNPAWASDFINFYLEPEKGVDTVLVVAADDSVLQSHRAGSGEGRTPGELFAQDIGPLLAEARRAPMAEPVAVGSIVRTADGRIEFLAASAITPERPSPEELAPKARPVLVLGRIFDQRFLSKLESDYLLRDPQILPPDGAPSALSLPLVSRDGETLGVLAWTLPLPGEAMLTKALPAAGGAFAVMAGLFFVFIRRAQRSAQALYDSKRLLEEKNDALAQSESRFRDLAEASSDGFWETDAALRVASRWGSAAESPPGTLDRLVEQALSGANLDHGEAARERQRRIVAERRPFRDATCQIEAPGEGLRFFKLAGKPVFGSDGAFRGYRGTLTDITLQQQTENALKRAKELAETTSEALEKRVAERTAELSELNERLKREVEERQRAETALRGTLEKERELGELKSRFIAVASHEFRTPLTTIAAASDLLLRYSDRMTEKIRQKNLEEIVGETQYMTDLLEDILTFERGRAKRIEFNPASVNLAEFCADLVNKARAHDDAKHPIEVSVADGLDNVLADEKLLRQILANLLSNAAKYSAPGSPIRLDVAEEGKQILFRVADEGMGIPEEDRPHLFEEFHRGANAVNMRGTGLGLAIAKKAADLHRGTIEFESELGRGTTFTVRLPARRPAGSAR